MNQLRKLGEQIVLKSRKAFETIKFKAYEHAPAELYYVKKAERDRTARREYLKNVRKNPGNNDLYMLDIMREGIKDGDLRLL